MEDHERKSVWVVLLAHLALVVPLAICLPVWSDEVYTMRTSSHGILESMRLGITFERQAPLYFGLVSLAQSGWNSIYCCRLFSVAASAFAIWVVAKTSSLLAPKINPIWPALLLCAHPFLVFAATESRVYSLLILSIALVCHGFVINFLAPSPGKTRRVLFVLVAVVALYTHYYVGFLLAALGLALLAIRPMRTFRTYITLMCIVAAFCLPMLCWLPHQLNESDGTKPLPYTAFEAGRFAFGLIRTFAFPASFHIVGELGTTRVGRHLGTVLQVAILLLLFLAGHRLLRFRDRDWLRSVCVWWIAFVAIAGIMALIGVIAGRVLVAFPRYWVILVVPSVLALSSLFGAMRSRRAIVLTVTATLAANAFDAFVTYRDLAKDGDGKRVASYIRQHEGLNQPIVIFPNRHALVLETYYRGVNRLVPLPRPARLEMWNVQDEVLRTESDITSALARTQATGSMLWLVFEPYDGRGFANYRPELVSGYFGRCYRMLRGRHFHGGIEVQLLGRMGDGNQCPDWK